MKYLDTAWFQEMEGRTYPLEKTRILLALYIAWALKNGLGGEIHTVDNQASLEKLRQETITPLEYCETCDDKLTDEDFNEEGGRFSEAYLKELYFEDYVNALERFDENALFDVEDSWESYRRLARVIDRRFANWRAGKDLKRAWWQFWK